MSKKYNTIGEIVRHYVPFVHGEAKGWNVVYCEVCGDGSRTKGPRGGWLFTEDKAFYNCFNAACEGSFDPDRKFPRSKTFTNILSSFGVPDSEVKFLELRHKATHKNDDPTVPQIRRVPIEPMVIPKHFYLLSEADDDDEIAEQAKEFLLFEKSIDPDSYPFYLSTGVPEKGASPRDAMIAKDLRKRLIIPAFRGENMIYYQARRLDGEEKNKYQSCDKPRANIIYGMDRLYDDIKSPLFVCEGFFDSHHLNGVATMENDLTSQQIELLSRSPRRKIIVPDYKGDSNKLAEMGVKEGWGISCPDFGSEVKDITEAVNKYGRLYVAHEIVSNMKVGYQAQIISKMKKR